MIKKNIILLDIDGVLCTFRSLWKGWAKAMGVTVEESDFLFDNPNGFNPVKMQEIDDIFATGKIPPPNIGVYKWPFDEPCVQVLNQIIKDNDADIVVISSWRIGRTKEELDKLLKEKGMIGNVIGRTGRQATRALEILEWLELAKTKYDYDLRICVIDDESLYDISYLFDEYCLYDISIRTNGLKEKHIEEAKNIFEISVDVNLIRIKADAILDHKEAMKNYKKE